VNYYKNDKSVVVLGSGAYRIGSSVEFDWCSVNAELIRQEQVITVQYCLDDPRIVTVQFHPHQFVARIASLAVAHHPFQDAPIDTHSPKSVVRLQTLQTRILVRVGIMFEPVHNFIYNLPFTMYNFHYFRSDSSRVGC